MTTPAAADLLATIVAATRRIVDVRRERESLAQLERRAHAVARERGRFGAALGARGTINIVAECKRRSPSRGVLRQEYDPAAIARSYANAGAAAISVLTEPTFFDGSLDHLASVRRTVPLPVLRKDFIVSEYQLHEACAAGADAVLLIVAALGPMEVKALHERAVALGLDVLVEVHDATELAIALDAGARIVGVNNRNLRTLQVDVTVSDALIRSMPADVIAVSESGLRTAEALLRLKACGYRAFLIGERFMASENPGQALKNLLHDITTRDTKDRKVQA